MNKDKFSESPFVFKINDLIKKTDDYSQYTNKILDNLAVPPGLYVETLKNEPQIHIYNTTDCSECAECIDNDLYLQLLKNAELDTSISSKKTKRSTKKKENNRNLKKSKKKKIN